MYLIRILNGRPAVMRDGRGKGKPMKSVSQDRFTLFNELPGGLTEHGGPGVEVRPVANANEAKALEQSLNKSLEAENAARAAYAKKVKAKRELIAKEAEAHKPVPEAKAGPQRAALHQQSHGGKGPAATTTKTE